MRTFYLGALRSALLIVIVGPAAAAQVATRPATTQADVSQSASAATSRPSGGSSIQSSSDLTSLDLEDLMNINVTSVSKQP
jgi:hypothetical protein